MADSRTYHYELKIGDIPEGETPEFEWKNIKIFENGIYAEGTETIKLSDEEKKMEEKEKEQRLREKFNEKLLRLIRKTNFIYFIYYKNQINGIYNIISYFGSSNKEKKENREEINIKSEQCILNFLVLPEYLQTKEGVKKALKIFENDIEIFKAGIINYAYAKQKGNTVENALDCFTYYWSSMNTFFSLYHQKCVKKQYEKVRTDYFKKKKYDELEKEKKDKKKEAFKFPTGDANELYSLAKLIDNQFNKKITDAELKRVIRKLSSFISEWDGERVTRESFEENGKYEAFAKEVETLYAEPSGAYVHFITRIAYQYRNSFLHENEAVPISKIQNDEYNPNIIKFINYLLDDFICSYLIKFMEYIENDENIPKAAKDVAEEIISEKIKKDGGNNQEAQPAAAQSNAANN